MDRERLPDEREGHIKRFSLKSAPRANTCPACHHKWEESRDFKVYILVGKYKDERPGELFIVTDKAGSTARGAFDAVAIAVSIGLQYGVPLSAYLEKFIGMRFGPGGFTGDKKYPRTGSVMDLVGRWLRDKFYPKPPEVCNPDGVVNPISGVMCPHGRPDGAPCPHCMGLDNVVKAEGQNNGNDPNKRNE